MRTYKFRGFHPDENGKTVIKLNGKEIQGFWCYGDLHTDGPYINEHKVIPETVGQLVMFDRVCHSVFEGDIVTFTLSESAIICTVIYENGGFVLQNDISKFYLNRLVEQGITIRVRNNIYEVSALVKETGVGKNAKTNM